MNTLTKTMALKTVAQKTGLARIKVKKTVEAVLTEIQLALAAGDRVEFRNFGVWEVKMSSARMGRNPSNPKCVAVPIPARPSVRFKPSKNLKSIVRTEPLATPPS